VATSAFSPRTSTDLPWIFVWPNLAPFAFKAAAADCTAAITQSSESVEDTVTNVDQAEISQSISELSVGVADLYVATETLREQ